MGDSVGDSKVRVGNARIVDKYYRQAGLPTIWCPGCGTGIVVNAMVRAIDKLGLNQDDVVIVTGIGCSGYLYNYLNFDGYHGTHGRALPAATGMKLANPRLKVIVPMGDGDCAAIGGNHFIHAARRNIDMTAIVINNSIYGMTGGQYSPMTPRNSVAATAPYGHVEKALDICAVAKAAGATYVARGTTYHVRQLIDLIAGGIDHKGFSVIEVISQCPIQFGRRNRQGDAADMLRWYKDKAVSVRAAAKMSPEELADRIVIGELHRVDDEPEYTEEYDRVIQRAQDRVKVRTEQPDQPGADGGAVPKVGRREIQIAGIGGQGLALAGVILAEAAGMHEGRHVTHTEVHGANARGGPSRSEVIISDDEIDFPFITATDVLVATTPGDVSRYLPSLKPDGILIVDSSVVSDVPDTTATVYRLPLTTIARSELGAEFVLGIVALAAIATISGFVSMEALEKAVAANVPGKAIDLNRRALAAGVSAARQAMAAADGRLQRPS